MDRLTEPDDDITVDITLESMQSDDSVPDVPERGRIEAWLAATHRGVWNWIGTYYRRR